MRRFWLPIVLVSFLLIPLLGCGKEEGGKGEPAAAQPGGGAAPKSLEEEKKEAHEKVRDLINKARKKRS